MNHRSTTKTNETIVEIFPLRSQHIQYTETLNMDFNQLIYNAGGVLGLWFGLSPLSIDDLVQVIRSNYVRFKSIIFYLKDKKIFLMFGLKQLIIRLYYLILTFIVCLISILSDYFSLFLNWIKLLTIKSIHYLKTFVLMFGLGFIKIFIYIKNYLNRIRFNFYNRVEPFKQFFLSQIMCAMNRIFNVMFQYFNNTFNVNIV